jgi:membrane-associated protease RseP (regulator of RpoE activity)
VLGGAIVIVGIILMVMIHEAGHFVAAKAFGMKATEFFFGFGPRLWSTTRGETEYGVKAIPLGGYVRIIGMNPFEEVAAEDEGRTYRQARFWQKSVVVLAGVGSNFLIGFLLLWIVASWIGTPDYDAPRLEVASVVIELDDGTPSAAAVAGIKRGDLLVAIDGVVLAGWDDVGEQLRPHPNEPVTITIERDGQLLELETTLSAQVEGSEVYGFLGVSPQHARSREGPIAGLGTAARQTRLLVGESARGAWALITGLGDLVTSVVGGDELTTEARPLSPIGIARLGSETQEVGLDLTLTVVAWVNIFVGLLNVLPMYPLDGGHFAVALYEKIRGRAPDVRKLVPVAAVVVIFLMLLGVLGIYLDIVDPLNVG